ncbi:helicase-related protein [Paenibacillus sp. FSL H7-0737]|uniref:DEAD/DEAH box helicase n=1 Tax=unclassified Paenibacillus TaxID=185978 RepID=UPI0004F5985A|nr:helicase-related protein [Paenibacillus sp. FSL H7-0737]AIQ22012.1 helicase [Paenibacillus sp. FSL H7-0737]
MIKVGEIVQGAQFPESVEIKKVEAFDEGFYSIAALGRDSNRYYELMLDEVELATLQRLFERSNTSHQMTSSDLQHYLRYHALLVNGKYSAKQTLGNKNLIPLPHQIEAVYSRMLQMPQVRFLLADDPGAGKTIMSGMLIKELKARGSVDRILILVPPLVLKQWQEELQEKFNEDFFIINRSVMKHYGSKNPFIEHDFCLTSIYWAARDDVKSLVNEADFDLVIVDEAHKMAAYTHGITKKKTSKTRLYHLGEAVLRQAKHCVLLTATPHKGDMENFRHLMRLVDDDIFSNLSATESLREKANPFIIRRLKESLKNFDGTPLFPKRTTRTIQYTLSEDELDLYEAVTEYVRLYFNRAMNTGSNSTAFAMMLLQRRLSSSVNAIDLSLKRRRDRLIKLLEDTMVSKKKQTKDKEEFDREEYEDESLETQELLEDELESATDNLDPEELRIEINELERLVRKTSYLKGNAAERKYDELEQTLFGWNGLLNQGEKILIFTESADTLDFLEKRLITRVPLISKIVGRLSMDERRRQVDLFRNNCQIMLATDAGGESINLQFCNQMINYDIPWNPNKLEQRMGRIHRIGQKNEVAVFNLVASNTREGDVMIRLLEKMERMREDLGADLVYDFIGEIVDGDFNDLASLMQAAVIHREKLDDIIASMERKLSEEHKKLLEEVEKERLSDDIFDLPKMRREQHDMTVKKLPARNYGPFTEHILKKCNVRIHQTQNEKVKRIERLPKYIRDISKNNRLPLYQLEEAIRFTSFQDYVKEGIDIISEDHPLCKLGMILTRRENEKMALERFMVYYPVNEPLSVEVYLNSITDGTGSELADELIFLAKRQDESLLRLDQYWLFQEGFVGELTALSELIDSSFRTAAVKTAMELRDEVRSKREAQLNRVMSYLDKTFKKQIDDLIEKRTKYEQENKENKNGALINQVDANLIDVEMRKERRLALVQRQKNIGMKPPKRIAQLEIVPRGKPQRVISVDYRDIIEEYERKNGRGIIRVFHPFSLVDFYSERFNGESRYIIVTNDEKYWPSEDYHEDLKEIQDKTYIYVVKSGNCIEEKKLGLIFLV